VTTITAQEIKDIIAMDGPNGNRAGAYMALWQLTGSNEALLQARISSFSGAVGGTAFAANDLLQRVMGNDYPGIYNLSDQVFHSSLNAILDHYCPVN
jgi:hypothetical protein